MTTHRAKRCAHCSIVYAYQGSGPRCLGAINDGRYCPDCMTVVLEALKTVPNRVEKTKEIVTGDEADQALKQLEQDEKNREIRAENPPEGMMFPMLRRVFPGLYDPETGARMTPECTHIDGVEYHISTWSDGREPPTVTRVMERDIQTGVTQPWRNIQR